MVCMFLIFVFLKIHFVQGEVIYTFGNGDASWKSASSACTLATPKINFTNGEMIAEFRGGVISMAEGEEAWLGYVLDSVILQNVGCMTYDVEKEPRLSTYHDTGADPGHCFSACRERGYIGLMKTKCFCFNSLPKGNMFETTCKQPCSKFDDDVSCGGNNVVSLYKRADGLLAPDVADFPISKNKGNCVLYDKNVKTFYATKCTLSYRIGCQRMSGEMVDMNSRTVTWLDMTGYCSSQRIYPYSYEGVLADSGDYVQVWTGMITARKLFKKYQGSGQPLAIAYVKVENGKHKVRFASPISTAVKRFICQEGKETTTTETTAFKVTDTFEFTDANTRASTKVKEANLLPLFIVIPIVLTLIAIVVILLVLRWRRKKRSKGLKSKDLMKSPPGKVDKRKGRSSKDALKMYDMIDTNKPTAEKKAAKRNSNVSNNLIATVSLENVIVDNDAFMNDTKDTNERSGKTTSFHGGTDKQSKDERKQKLNRNTTNKDNAGTESDPKAKENNSKNDDEYARINKKRKESGPKKNNDGQMYDRLGAGKDDDNNKLETNYDTATFGIEDPDSYDTTSKPVTVPQRDYLYDGLHRF